MSRYDDADKWDMWHKIINTVRYGAGLPLRPNTNPYRRAGNDNCKHSLVDASASSAVHSISM